MHHSPSQRQQTCVMLAGGFLQLFKLTMFRHADFAFHVSVALQGLSALHLACKGGHQALVKTLLANNANADTVDKQVSD